jgi:hypothetical protein
MHGKAAYIRPKVVRPYATGSYMHRATLFKCMYLSSSIKKGENKCHKNTSTYSSKSGEYGSSKLSNASLIESSTAILYM